MSDEHLTHGWEPDLPASDSILRAFVLSLVDRSHLLTESVHGRFDRSDDLALADPASPVFFDNAAVLLQPPAYVDLDDVVERTLAFYPADRHFVLMSAWPTPDLSGHGLALMGHPPLMVRPAGGTAPPLPAGFEIRAVDDEQSLDEFVTVITEAYPIPSAAGTALADPSILGGAISLFVGRLDGRPVATSGVHVGRGLNDVEWVSTMPTCRGRGIGAAITWAATLTEPTLPAVLIASDLGQPVYEAMGYMRIQRLTMWHRPPQAQPA
jgi:hypothetical protein